MILFFILSKLLPHSFSESSSICLFAAKKPALIHSLFQPSLLPHSIGIGLDIQILIHLRGCLFALRTAHLLRPLTGAYSHSPRKSLATTLRPRKVSSFIQFAANAHKKCCFECAYFEVIQSGIRSFSPIGAEVVPLFARWPSSMAS